MPNPLLLWLLPSLLRLQLVRLPNLVLLENLEKTGRQVNKVLLGRKAPAEMQAMLELLAPRVVKEFSEELVLQVLKGHQASLAPQVPLVLQEPLA